MLIDTHTHLYLPEFEPDGGVSAVERAIEAGVGRMVMPNVGLDTIEPMQRLAEKFPDHISMAMGLHPTEVGESWSDDIPQVLEILANGNTEAAHRRYVALGEVGIDLYWDKTFESEQMQALDMQLARAEALDLPVIIHCREGLDQTLEVLQDHKNITAVWHSFGGTVADVERIRSQADHYFGINGIATFKNCKVRDSITAIGLNLLLLETDSPYLAPVPHRGKRNESAYILHTAHHIASHLGIDFDTLADTTTANATRFFKGF